MKNFDNILNEYEQIEKELLRKVKEQFIDVNSVAPKFNATKSTTYSKLNGNTVLLHHEKLILAEMTRTDKTPLIEYEEYLTNFSKFIEENKIFRQDYFLKIIHKDNIGLKKRFKNPLLWKPEEILNIISSLHKDLGSTPFFEFLT